MLCFGGNTYVGTFVGNGAGLTNLAGASLPSGLVTNNGMANVTAPAFIGPLIGNASSSTTAMNVLNMSVCQVYTNGTYIFNGVSYSTNLTNEIQAVFDTVNAATTNNWSIGAKIVFNPGDYPFATNVYLNHSLTKPVNLYVSADGARWNYVGGSNTPASGGLIKTAGVDANNFTQATGSKPIFNCTFDGLTVTANQDWNGGANYNLNSARMFFSYQGANQFVFNNCTFLSSNAVALKLTKQDAFGFNTRASGLVWIGDWGAYGNTVVHNCWFAGGALGITSLNNHLTVYGNTFSECGVWDDGVNYYGGISTSLSGSTQNGTTVRGSLWTGFGDTGSVGGGILEAVGQITADGLNSSCLIENNTFNYVSPPWITQAETPGIFQNNTMLSPAKLVFGETPPGFAVRLHNNTWNYVPMTGFTNTLNQPVLSLPGTVLSTNLTGLYVEDGVPDSLSGGTSINTWLWGVFENQTNAIAVDYSLMAHVNIFVSTNANLNNSLEAYVFKHNLGATPKVATAYLVCTANDSGSGMVVGDESEVTGWINQTVGGSMFTVIKNSTNIVVACGSTLVGNESSVAVNGKVSGGTPNPTSFNNFKLKVVAFP